MIIQIMMICSIVKYNEDGSIVLPPDVQAAKDKKERKEKANKSNLEQKEETY